MIRLLWLTVPKLAGGQCRAFSSLHPVVLVCGLCTLSRPCTPQDQASRFLGVVVPSGCVRWGQRHLQRDKGDVKCIAGSQVWWKSFLRSLHRYSCTDITTVWLWLAVSSTYVYIALQRFGSWHTSCSVAMGCVTHFGFYMNAVQNVDKDG